MFECSTVQIFFCLNLYSLYDMQFLTGMFIICRCFSSSGETSSVDDYLWLMGRACYKPVIEYCGGTEIGGAFVSGSLLQPQALSAFSTPVMGCSLFILDSSGNPLVSISQNRIFCTFHFIPRCVALHQFSMPYASTFMPAIT